MNDAEFQTEVGKVSQGILEYVIGQNPQMDVLLTALATNVVGFSIQYVHAGNGEITHEEVTKQLARFYSYCVDLASLKVPAVIQQLEDQKKLEG